jgi:hypothetical protein
MSLTVSVTINRGSADINRISWKGAHHDTRRREPFAGEVGVEEESRTRKNGRVEEVRQGSEGGFENACRSPQASF